MLKFISALVITTSTLFVGCNSTEEFKTPTNASDALVQLEQCYYSSKINDVRLADSMKLFHTQESKGQELSLEYVLYELNYCRTGEDLS